jgi:tRNA 2-selenouridine synthase
MFNLILDKKYRIKRIVNEYAGFDKKLLIHPIKMIEKYLGGLNAKEAIKAIENNDFEKAIEVLLIYYDKAYKKMIKKRSANKISEISIINDAEKNATIISNMISKFA